MKIEKLLNTQCVGNSVYLRFWLFYVIVHNFTVRKFHSLQFEIFCFRELEFFDVFLFGFMTIKDFLFVLAISFFFGLFHFY